MPHASTSCPRLRLRGRLKSTAESLALALLALITVCCEPPAADRWAIESASVTNQEKPRWKPILTPAEQRDIRQAMRAVPQAENDQPHHPPTPAAEAMRWADVPRAAPVACAEIEAAVFHTVERDSQYVFRLRTIDDRPGTMIVTRTDDERVYELNITIGYFPGNEELEQQLRDAFRKKMKTFGEKPRFTDNLAPEPNQ